MPRESLEQLTYRWRNEPQFREALRRDLEGTLARADLQFTEDEWAVLRDTDWDASDEDLQTRMADVIG